MPEHPFRLRTVVRAMGNDMLGLTIQRAAESEAPVDRELISLRHDVSDAA